VNVKGLANLEHLCLSGTGITDAGLRQLVNLPRLQTLVLAHTAVTDTGLEQLKRMIQIQTAGSELYQGYGRWNGNTSKG